MVTLQGEFDALATRAGRLAAASLLLGLGLLALAVALVFRAVDLRGWVEPWSPLIAGSVALVAAGNGIYWSRTARRVPSWKPRDRRRALVRRIVILAIASPILVVVLVLAELAALLGTWLYGF